MFSARNPGLHAIALALSAALLAACATKEDTAVPETAALTPKSEVAAAVETWKAGLLSRDIARMMASYSEHFTHPEWTNKAGAQSYLEDAKDNGNLDKLEIGTADAQIDVDGARATAYPIHVSGGFGSLVYELIFAQENGHWLIVEIKSSGA